MSMISRMAPSYVSSFFFLSFFFSTGIKITCWLYNRARIKSLYMVHGNRSVLVFTLADEGESERAFKGCQPRDPPPARGPQGILVQSKSYAVVSMD